MGHSKYSRLPSLWGLPLSAKWSRADSTCCSLFTILSWWVTVNTLGYPHCGGCPPQPSGLEQTALVAASSQSSAGGVLTVNTLGYPHCGGCPSQPSGLEQTALVAASSQSSAGGVLTVNTLGYPHCGGCPPQPSGLEQTALVAVSLLVYPQIYAVFMIPTFPLGLIL